MGELVCSSPPPAYTPVKKLTKIFNQHFVGGNLQAEIFWLCFKNCGRKLQTAIFEKRTCLLLFKVDEEKQTKRSRAKDTLQRLVLEERNITNEELLDLFEVTNDINETLI